MKLPRKTAVLKLRTGIALTVSGAAFTPGSVHALGIRVPDQDPFAIARGNAFVATANNPSAIYYNPAGISQLAGHNFSLGANILSVSDEYTSTSGANYDIESKVHVLPQFYYTFTPESMPVSFGVGLYSPFGLGVEWPDQTPFRELAIKGEMAYGTINPVVSWAINDRISIGAGVMVNYAETTLTRGLTPMNAPPAGNNLEFQGDGWSVGFNLGVLWEITEKHSVGATYRSASEIDFTGNSTYSPAIVPTGNSSAEFQFPQNITVGYSFRPSDKWNLEVNIDWTDWDSLNTINLIQTPPAPDLALPFNWESSWMFQFGGTRYLESGWRVSAGYIFSQNSVPDEWFNPSIPDSDRHVFSVGGGRTWKNNVSFDAALQYGYGPERTVSNPPTLGNIGGAANGDYVFNSISFVIAGGYSF